MYSWVPPKLLKAIYQGSYTTCRFMPFRNQEMTIELSPWLQLVVTNEIRTLHRLHGVASNYVIMCLADVSMLLSNHAVR